MPSASIVCHVDPTTTAAAAEPQQPAAATATPSNNKKATNTMTTASDTTEVDTTTTTAYYTAAWRKEPILSYQEEKEEAAKARAVRKSNMITAAPTITTTTPDDHSQQDQKPQQQNCGDTKTTNKTLQPQQKHNNHSSSSGQLDIYRNSTTSLSQPSSFSSLTFLPIHNEEDIPAYGGMSNPNTEEEDRALILSNSPPTSPLITNQPPTPADTVEEPTANYYSPAVHRRALVSLRERFASRLLGNAEAPKIQPSSATPKGRACATWTQYEDFALLCGGGTIHESFEDFFVYHFPSRSWFKPHVAFADEDLESASDERKRLLREAFARRLSGAATMVRPKGSKRDFLVLFGGIGRNTDMSHDDAETMLVDVSQLNNSMTVFVSTLNQCYRRPAEDRAGCPLHGLRLMSACTWTSAEPHRAYVVGGSSDGVMEGERDAELIALDLVEEEVDLATETELMIIGGRSRSPPSSSQKRRKIFAQWTKLPFFATTTEVHDNDENAQDHKHNHNWAFHHGGLHTPILGVNDEGIPTSTTLTTNTDTAVVAAHPSQHQHLSQLLPLPRGGHTATVIGDRMFIFGGALSSMENSSALLVYDFRSQTLATLHCDYLLSLQNEKGEEGLVKEWPSARYGHCAWGDPSNDRLYIFGGDTENSSVYFQDLWCYEIRTGEWFEVHHHSPAGKGWGLQSCGQLGYRSGHQSVTYKGEVFVFGGEMSATETSEDPFGYVSFEEGAEPTAQLTFPTDLWVSSFQPYSLQRPLGESCARWLNDAVPSASSMFLPECKGQERGSADDDDDNDKNITITTTTTTTNTNNNNPILARVQEDLLLPTVRAAAAQRAASEEMEKEKENEKEEKKGIDDDDEDVNPRQGAEGGGATSATASSPPPPPAACLLPAAVADHLQAVSAP